MGQNSWVALGPCSLNFRKPRPEEEEGPFPCQHFSGALDKMAFVTSWGTVLIRRQCEVLSAFLQRWRLGLREKPNPGTLCGGRPVTAASSRKVITHRLALLVGGFWPNRRPGCVHSMFSSCVEFLLLRLLPASWKV